MKKNKSKKLKKQFKQLLHQHISMAKEGKSLIQKDETENKTEELIKKVSPEDKNTSDKFAKKDIIKTTIIASFLVISISVVGFYLNKNNLFSEVIEFLTNLIK